MSDRLLNALVILAYLATAIGVGAMAARRTRNSSENYFVGGRKMPWYIVGISLYAMNIGATQLVGQTGLAYEIGLAAANPQLMGAFMLGVSAMFFVPLIVRSKILTIPDLLEKRYGTTAKTLFSITLVTMGVLGGPVALYAGGLAVLAVLGIDSTYLWACCLATGLVVGTYTVRGGLATVMMVDAIHGIVMLTGGCILLLVTWSAFSGSAGDVVARSHRELLLPAGNPYMPWTGVFSGLVFSSLFWATSNGGQLQRVIAARSVYDARCGMVMAGLLKVATVSLIIVPGIFASTLFPGLDPDATFPTLVNELLPPGLSGLIMAGLIAALISSIDSRMNFISSIFTLNIYPLLNRRARPEQALLVGRIAAIAMLVWGVLAAPFVGELGLIYPLILKIGAFLLAPPAVCYLAGRFSRRVNRAAALTVLITGYGIGSALLVLTSLPGTRFDAFPALRELHFYHLSALSVLFYVALLFVVSWLTPPPPPEQVERFMLLVRAETTDTHPWYLRFGLWCGFLLGGIVLLYVVF